MLAHAYFGLEEHTLWLTVTRSIPELLIQLNAVSFDELTG